MSNPIVYLNIISPPCRTVLLTAKAIGVDLDIRDVNMNDQEHLKEDFLKMNPQHTVPVLDDNGFTLWDSHAIVCYLVDKYGKDDSLYPRNLEQRAIIDQYLFFESETMFSRFRNVIKPVLYFGKPPPEDGIAELKASCAMLNHLLEGKKWLVGDSYTIADISCVSSVAVIPTMFPIDQYPNIVTWLENCERELPDYKETSGPGLQAMIQMIKPIFQN